MPYAGITVPPLFHQRWKSGQQIGDAKPTGRIEIRRGHFHHRWHTFEEAGSLGRHGHVAHSQRLWYPDWIPDTPWEAIDGVKNIRLEQSFDNKGVEAATIDLDNIALQAQGSGLGLYHTIERGVWTPLRGYVFPGRQNLAEIRKNEHFMQMPNAQIRVWFSYGDDAETFAFTGLIDDVEVGTQGQTVQVLARDFGGVMVDQPVFGWAKDRAADDPVTFMPKDLHREVTYVGANARASSHEPGHAAQPNVVLSGHHNAWMSEEQEHPTDVEWVQIHVPRGRYEGVYVVGEWDHQKFYVGVLARSIKNRAGIIRPAAWHPNHGPAVALWDDQLDVRDHDRSADGLVVPSGWVNLNGAAQMMPADPHGTDPQEWPIWRGPHVTKRGKGIHVNFGGELFLGADSVIRIGLTPLRQRQTIRFRDGRPIYEASLRTVKAKRVREIDRSIKKGENHIPVGDVSEIAETVFRWMGFKEWEVESTGVDLKQPYVVGKDKKFMDIMDDLQAQTGYVFFMGAPSDNGDTSIGRPIFRNNRIFEPVLDHQEQVTGKDLLEDVKVKYTNADERSVIRTRGKALSRKHGGRKLADDSIYRAMYSYTPPWVGRMAGVIKPLTHYDPLIETIDQCRVACYLIALQICLGVWTAIADLPGTPGVSIDSFVSIVDDASGTNSRLYVSNRVQEFTAGTNAKYTLELGGSIPDTPDTKKVFDDYWSFMGSIDPNDGPHKRRRKKRPHKHKKGQRQIGHAVSATSSSDIAAGQ